MNNIIKGIIKKIKTVIYNKPIGYISPVENCNDGKQKEFKNRKNFKVDEK